MLTFTINANPDTNWRVRVTVHDTRKDLHRARIKDGDVSEGELAFCARYSDQEAIKDPNGIFAEIHLCKGRNLKISYIAHEVIHCLIGYFALQRLRLVGATGDIEEHAAYTAEALVEVILKTLKKRGYKLR